MFFSYLPLFFVLATLLAYFAVVYQVYTYMDCVLLPPEGNTHPDSTSQKPCSFSSIVYYKLSLASFMSLSNLACISTSEGKIPTAISTNRELLTPICSES